MNKRILITGGTGFIGSVLCPQMRGRGYELTVLSRQPADKVRALCGQVEAINDLESLRSHTGYDAVINLAGEGIADKRWTDERKQILRDSRIGLTNTLTEIIRSWAPAARGRGFRFCCRLLWGSGQHLVTEDTAPHDEFAHQLCRDWENAALKLQSLNVRVCLSRTGVVVGPGGGFLQRMMLPFKLGLGGRLGNGHQYMPWVHRDDVVAALIWMLETPEAEGAYNVVSPNPATNRDFTRCLASVLRRPAVFPAPAPILKIALGEMSRLLLTGQQALPARLTGSGFGFLYPTLGKALENATG